MKFKDRKQKRHVNEAMADMLLKLQKYSCEDMKECISITLRILQETEVEEQTGDNADGNNN